MNLLRRFRRRVCEHVGIDKYSYPALNKIDKKLLKYLEHKNGFFVEAGANNGYRQSNTYYLERFRGWHGILIEGIPELYRQCVHERPNSKVYNYGLVSSEYKDDNIRMNYADLMSVVDGAFDSPTAAEAHYKKGVEIQKIENHYEINVCARTLSSVLDEYGLTEPIDLLSLDVEGYEVEVLKGIDFNRHCPKYILVEARNIEAIEELLTRHYRLIDQFSHHDYLFMNNNSEL